MANRDNAKRGFIPYSNPYGGSGQPIAREYKLAAANSEIGVGDPVVLTGGFIDLATGSPIRGVAAEYKAASAGGYIKVWDDPDQLFTAQCDDASTGTGDAATAIGLNIGHVNEGSLSGKFSLAELDESSAATTATLTWFIEDLSPEYNGENGEANAQGAYCRYIVRPNNHQGRGGTGVAGT